MTPDIATATISPTGIHSADPWLDLSPAGDAGQRRMAVAYVSVVENDPEPSGVREAIRLRLGNAHDLRPDLVLDESVETYLYPPVLCWAGGDHCAVFWARGRAEEWSLEGRLVAADGDHCRPLLSLADAGRRYHNPRCAADNAGRIWLTWEEHAGRDVRVMVRSFQGDRWSDAAVISDPACNAYDPQVAISSDGTAWLAWTEYREGVYRVACRPMEGAKPGRRQTIPCGQVHSHYPAVAADGGRLYVTWLTCDGPDTDRAEAFWVRTPLRRHVQSFWSRPQRLHLACLEDGKWLEPDTAPAGGGGVVPVQRATFSAPVVDEAGTVWILARRFRSVPGQAVKSVIQAVTWHEGGWQEPSDLMDEVEGGEDRALSCAIADGRLWVVYQRDDRALTCNWDYLPGLSEIRLASVELSAVGNRRQPMRPMAAADAALRPLSQLHPARTTASLDNGKKTYSLVFGQIHRHTDLSPCGKQEGTPDWQHDLHYRHAMDVQGESFGACTDHGFSMDAHDWRRTMKMAAFYNRAGCFVALPGEEWTSSGPRPVWRYYGHLNVYHLDEMQEMLNSRVVTERTPWQIWRKLDPQRSLTIPHHPADKMHPYDWSAYDPAFVPVVEIFQDGRGSSEHPGCIGTTSAERVGDPSCYVQSALSAGAKLGFIGGGDHFGVALAGLYVTELTRKGVLEALRARRCFATTGCQAFLDFRVNDALMGEEITAPGAGATRTISASARAPSPVKRMVLVRNGEDISSAEGGQLTYTDDTDLEPQVYYYVRVEFENGELAWSSPVWVVPRVGCAPCGAGMIEED